MKCQNCGTEIKNQAKFCHKCGAKMEEPEKVITEIKENSVANSVCQVWPEWQIEYEPIGRGSYGVVYRAVRKDNNIESYAAIKVISIPSDSSEVDSIRSEGLNLDGTKTYFQGVVNDFVSEIQLMESLKGIQNIVSVEDYKVVEKSNTIGWDIYIRMELLTPFNSYICDKTLSEKEVIKLGCDICTALEICGKRNIIHRDIKPENIFVNDFGHFKLGDFGIARKLENITSGLSQKGTHNYMAPEVAKSNNYDARVDTYSLGIVLYRLLNNNKLPFLDTDKQLLSPNERKRAVERRIQGEALPAPCNASSQMANVILKACTYNPKDRFATATEMKQALLSAANGTYVVSNVSVSPKAPAKQMKPNYNATTVAMNTPIASKQSQNPVANNFDKSNKKAKKQVKKGKIIAISIFVGIITIAIALASIVLSSSAFGVFRDFKSESYDTALSNYKINIKDDFIEETLLKAFLGSYADDIVNDYKNGEISYDVAMSGLDALAEMGFDSAKDKKEEIETLYSVSMALEKADEYYADGDYENAIKEYSKVPESSENYNDAQAKISEICPKYIDLVKAKAMAYNNEGKYKEAVGYINTAIDILPKGIDTTELESIKTESLANYKTDVSSQVTEFVNDSNYAEAFEIIDEAIAFDDDQYFKDLRTTTEKKYVEYIDATVKSHLNNEDYISAARVVSNALTVLPDNADLEKIQSNVEKATPTYLLDVVKPYETFGYAEFVDGETVSLSGKAYTNGFSLGGGSSWESNEYALFNIDRKYSTLSFSVGHQDKTEMVDTTIKLYCDGVLKKEFPITSDSLPIKISLDVTGVSQVKIVADVSRDTRYGFVNVIVK